MKRNEPAKGFRKLLRVVLPAFIVLLAGFAGSLVVLTWRVTHPGAVQEPVNPSHFLLDSRDVTWSGSAGEEMNGWWIAGRRGAPGILLSPGYGMSRSDVLSLAVPLNNAGFHVLIHAQRGCNPAGTGASSLGLYEKDDMESALGFMRAQPGVDAGRLGAWGADEGARAALAMAASHPEVLAIAADTPYEYVLEFLTVRLREELGTGNSLIEYGCRQVFRLSHLGSYGAAAEPLPLDPLADRNILFIQGSNRKEMAPLVASLYGRLGPKKEMMSLPASRSRLLSGAELKNYDRQVADFFRKNLAATGNRD